MNHRPCWDCGRTEGAFTVLPHGRICLGCRRRRHYHPEPCPGCGQVRPLAYLDNALVVCASCAGAVSIFACRQCGREDNLYGATRCARCILRERLTALLTDPATGQVHVRLRAVFDELVGSDRPQAGIWWLRKEPGTGPRLLAQMAAGQIEISHDTFRALPSDRAHDYLRGLLAAVGVLAPFEIRIERMAPWLETVLADLPADQAALIRRFAHWYVLPRMRTAARQDRLTQTMANAARRRIRVAIDFLAFLGANDATATSATQGMLERYQVANPSNRSYVHAFLVWLRDSRINTGLHIPWVPQPAPAVTVSHEQRWRAVDRLLHDHTLRRYTRIGGLFTLLFAHR